MKDYPFRGTCYVCKEDGDLHAITSQCFRCFDAEQAETTKRMKEDALIFAGWEKDRLDHIESCRWCREASDTFGTVPPSYKCPKFGAAIRREAAKTEAA